MTDKAFGKRFILVRTDDVSGVSGTGTVAEGIEFHNGVCALSWYGKYESIGIYPNLEELEAIHGHEGRTRVMWVDLTP